MLALASVGVLADVQRTEPAKVLPERLLLEAYVNDTPTGKIMRVEHVGRDFFVEPKTLRSLSILVD
ncbi:MAG: hypothetical protein ACN6OP_24700, partial [Pseudomonadales bacterium]